MDLSNKECREVVAQLRKWLGEVVRSKKWILCGHTVDDVIGDAMVRYFEDENARDSWIREHFPPEKRCLGLIKLLAVICHGVIIDRWRKAEHGLALEQPYPTEIEGVPALITDPSDQYIYNIFKTEFMDAADPADREYIESFISLAEGPIETPNQQVAEDLGVPINKVVNFKKRMARGR